MFHTNYHFEIQKLLINFEERLLYSSPCWAMYFFFTLDEYIIAIFSECICIFYLECTVAASISVTRRVLSEDSFECKVHTNLIKCRKAEWFLTRVIIHMSVVITGSKILRLSFVFQQLTFSTKPQWRTEILDTSVHFPLFSSRKAFVTCSKICTSYSISTFMF